MAPRTADTAFWNTRHPKTSPGTAQLFMYPQGLSTPGAMDPPHALMIPFMPMGGPPGASLSPQSLGEAEMSYRQPIYRGSSSGSAARPPVAPPPRPPAANLPVQGPLAATQRPLTQVDALRSASSGGSGALFDTDSAFGHHEPWVETPLRGALEAPSTPSAQTIPTARIPQAGVAAEVQRMNAQTAAARALRDLPPRIPVPPQYRDTIGSPK